jgi:glutamate-1-semialdehyde 2,1-aminomutase
MIRNGVLMPWIALAYKHSQVELDITEKALNQSFGVLKKAIDQGIDKYLIGPAIKPVFRKLN